MEKIIIKDYSILKSIKKVAIKNNLSYDRIRNILKSNNVSMVWKNTKNIENITKAIEEYKQGTSLNQLNKKYGFDHNVFKKILSKNGIEYINRAKNPIEGEVITIKENLNDILSYYKKTNNIRKTSIFFGVKECNLYRYLKSENLLIRKNEKISTEKEQQIKDEIYNLYVNGNLNTADIGKKYNITRYNIKKILISNFGNEVIKPKSEIIRNMNLSEGFQENALKKNYRNKNYILPSGRMIQVMGYEDHFLDFVFGNNILKEEDFSFDRGFRIKISDKGKHIHYYPDFHIPKFNMIIEIKSKYTYENQKKLNNLKIKKSKSKGYITILIVDKHYEEFLKTINETSS
jgi:hypothetical protein